MTTEFSPPQLGKAQAFLRWFEQDTGLGIALRRRRRSMVLTRWAVMLVLNSWNLSTTEIGEMIDRDHSTVSTGLHRARRIPEVVQYADDLKERFEGIWLTRQPQQHPPGSSGSVKGA